MNESLLIKPTYGKSRLYVALTAVTMVCLVLAFVYGSLSVFATAQAECLEDGDCHDDYLCVEKRCACSAPAVPHRWKCDPDAGLLDAMTVHQKGFLFFLACYLMGFSVLTEWDNRMERNALQARVAELERSADPLIKC